LVRALEKQENEMALEVAELCIELIEALRPLLLRIKQRDKSQADQITERELDRAELRRG